MSSSGEELEDWRWLPPAVCWLTLVHPLTLHLPLQDCLIKCQGRTLKLRGFLDYADAKLFDCYMLYIEICCVPVLGFGFWLEFQIWLLAGDTNSETKKTK